MSKLILCKYGGSVINTQEDLDTIAKITEDDKSRKIIIVSAPGKVNSSRKVTDMLIDLANTRDESLKDKILERYKMLSSTYNINDLSKLLNNKISSNLEGQAYEDNLKSFGEEACAKVIAKEIGAEYVPAEELFLVSEDFGKAQILSESKYIIRKRLDNLERPIVTGGFYGKNRNNLIVTLDRNASDVSGGAIADALDAEVYEILKEKKGVNGAQPEFISDAKMIEELTFDEMRALSYAGFSVLHPSTIEYVEERSIPVHVRSTLDYPNKGTYVVKNRITDSKKPIVGIAYRNGFCAFTLNRTGLNDMKGVLVDILSVFRDDGISVEHTPTGIDDVSIVFRQDQLSVGSVGYLSRKLQRAMGGKGNVDILDNLGCLVVAGRGLARDYIVSATIPTTLYNAGIRPIFVSEGINRNCIIYGIEHADANKAVNAVYDRYLRN